MPFCFGWRRATEYILYNFCCLRKCMYLCTHILLVMRSKHNTYTHNSFYGIYTALIVCIVMLVASCHDGSTPRPRGYFRIDGYPCTYSPTHIGNISFLINDSALQVTPAQPIDKEVYWLNIVYPRYNATIYLSYLPLHNNLEQVMSESIELVYRQNVNTEQVEAVAYENDENKLYATLFTLSAESATPLQFIATDSSQYLLRGALYYDTPVKPDSVAPTLYYLEEDIMYLIESITTQVQ